MSIDFSSWRNFYFIRKALSLLLLSVFVLAYTVTNAEQFDKGASGKESNSSTDNKALTRLTNTDKKSAKKLSQSLLPDPVKARLLQQKKRPAPIQENPVQNTKQAVTSNKLLDKVTKKTIINQPKLEKQNSSTASEIPTIEVVNKPEKIALEIPNRETLDGQYEVIQQVDTSEVIAEVPKAKNVDLEKPISESDIVPVIPASVEIINETALDSAKEDETVEGSDSVVIETEENVEQKTIVEVHDKPFLLLGAEVSPATSTRLAWSPSQSFKGIAAPTPVLVVNGIKAGPVLCITAAIHGDELNGIEIVRRVLYNLDVNELSGTVIGVPIVNLQGFRRTSRYLSDRRDLNRFFPGNPHGSSASRIAYSFFHEIISHCTVLVDLHTGSFHRTNLPQLRADLKNTAVVEVTQGFGATVILQSTGAKGTLRRAAVDAGIPAVTLEAGEPMRLQEDQVSHGVKGIQTLLNQLGMYDYSSFWGDPEPVYYKSKWVRANQGGILFSEMGLGKKVKKGDVLGSITDPITNVRKQVISPYQGRIIGMALNQVVMPGFAAFHIGIQTTEEEVAKKNADLADATINTTSENGVEENKKNVVEIQKKILNVDETEDLESSE